MGFPVSCCHFTENLNCDNLLTKFMFVIHKKLVKLQRDTFHELILNRLELLISNFINIDQFSHSKVFFYIRIILWNLALSTMVDFLFGDIDLKLNAIFAKILDYGSNLPLCILNYGKGNLLIMRYALIKVHISCEFFCYDISVFWYSSCEETFKYQSIDKKRFSELIVIHCGYWKVPTCHSKLLD